MLKSFLNSETARVVFVAMGGAVSDSTRLEERPHQFESDVSSLQHRYQPITNLLEVLVNVLGEQLAMSDLLLQLLLLSLSTRLLQLLLQCLLEVLFQLIVVEEKQFWIHLVPVSYTQLRSGKQLTQGFSSSRAKP